MPTPANRAKIQIARGTFSNIDSSKGDLLDGELAYAKDLNQLYMKEGSTLQQVTAEPEQLYVEVHNDTGATLTKGKVVHVSGTHSNGKPTVALADATTADSKFPAIGLVSADIADAAEGRILISGILSGLNTNAFNAGDSLYLSATVGDLTATRPTASTDKVQKVALCTRKHATAGDVLVIGAGRVNDVNNEITALTGVALDAVNLGSFTGTTIADNETVKGALQDLETAVENSTTITNGSANQIFAMNAAGNAFGFVDNVTIPGDLTVSGTTTTINTQTLDVEDKNIELGKVGTPTDTTADGGGITLKGTSDHTITWLNATDAWTFSEHINIGNGKEYRINGTSVLTGTTLGSNVTTSSLTTVGNISTGTWSASTIAVDKGGTGQTTYADGQLLIGGNNSLNKSTLSAGSNVTITNGTGTITIAATNTNTTYTAGDGLDLSGSDEFSVDLKANGGLAIESTELAVDLGASSITGTLAVGDGGSGQTSYTDGQLLIGNSTGNTLAKATLTAGNGIDVTNGGGSISIAADVKANSGIVIDTTELALDLGASSITGTLAVGDGGTGLTAAAKGSVLVANAVNTISALDGGGSNDGILTYTATSDTIAWATEIDGGTY